MVNAQMSGGMGDKLERHRVCSLLLLHAHRACRHAVMHAAPLHEV
jgi:hypothetical protein